MQGRKPPNLCVPVSTLQNSYIPAGGQPRGILQHSRMQESKIGLSTCSNSALTTGPTLARCTHNSTPLIP